MAGEYDERRDRPVYDADDEQERPYRPRVAPGKLSRSGAVYGRVFRAAASAAPVEADPRRIDAAARTSGQALPEPLRAELEQSIGADLGAVRVHTGAESADAAQSIHARAFATGSDIHFAPGTYDPESDDGRRLIAHEVAHTVQQAGAPAVQAKLEVSEPGDAAEVEADRFADAFATGHAAPLVSPQRSGVLARTPAPLAAPARTRDDADSDDERAADPLDGERAVRLAEQLLDRLTGTFAPNHLAARDGLRAERARSNGHKAAASILRIRAHVDIAKAASIARSGSAQLSRPGQPNETDQFLQRIACIEDQVAAFAGEIAPFMGLQAFRGELVPGNGRIGGGDLAREIDAASELATLPMHAAAEVREHAERGAANDAAAVIKRFGLDDAQQRFLFRILEADNLYGAVEQGATLEQGSSGRARSKSVATVRAEANDAAGGVPTSVDGVFQRLEEAKAAFVAGDTDTALARVGEAQAALRSFAKNYDRVVDSFGGMARMKIDSARGAAQHLEKLSAYARIKRGKPGVGALYDASIGELSILREPLELLAGEIEPGQATLLHALDKGTIVGPAVLASIPALPIAAALAVKALPVIASVVARSGGPLMAAARSAKLYVLTNPIAAQEIAALATGLGIEALDLGIEEFLDQLSTPEGLLMLLLELLITRNAVDGTAGGRSRSRGGADAPSAVEPPPRSEAPAGPALPRDTIPTNQSTKPHPNSAGDEELERRVQEIIEELETAMRSAVETPRKRPTYAPKDADGKPLPLPRGPGGNVAPDAMDPHTQIGWRKGRRGDYIQTREFGEDGRPVKQVDWTDHGRPREHTDPHVHDYLDNETGGTRQVGSARPPEEGEL